MRPMLPGTRRRKAACSGFGRRFGSRVHGRVEVYDRLVVSQDWNIVGGQAAVGAERGERK